MAKKRGRLTSWEDLDRQDEVDRPILEKHGLSAPLDIYPGQPDWREIDRQVQYLLDNLDNIPRTTLCRRATTLLVHFMTGREPPSGEIVLLMGQLLDVSALPVKYAKRPAAVLHAQRYLQEHPNASNAEIAKHVRVHKSNVGRWKKRGWLRM